MQDSDCCNFDCEDNRTYDDNQTTTPPSGGNCRQPGADCCSHDCENDGCD